MIINTIKTLRGGTSMVTGKDKSKESQTINKQYPDIDMQQLHRRISISLAASAV